MSQEHSNGKSDDTMRIITWLCTSPVSFILLVLCLCQYLLAMCLLGFIGYRGISTKWQTHLVTSWCNSLKKLIFLSRVWRRANIRPIFNKWPKIWQLVVCICWIGKKEVLFLESSIIVKDGNVQVLRLRLVASSPKVRNIYRNSCEYHNQF